MKKRIFTLLSACALLLAGGSAHGIVIDFSTDQTNLFDSNGGNDYTYSSTAGIGGTGGLVGGVDGAVWSYNVESYTFDGPEDIITFSMDTKFNASYSGTGIPIRIGLQDTGPEGFGDYAVRLDARDSSVDFEHDDSSTAIGADTFSLTDGNWYRGEFTIRGTANTSTTGEFEWSFDIFDLGSNGMSTPVSIASDGGMNSNNYFLNSDTEPLELSFKVDSAAAEIDNISIAIIPEPSAAALLMGVLGALLLVRRRR